MKLFSAFIMVSGIFYGLMVTGGSELFINIIIMPIVGGIGYYLFRTKGILAIPAILYLSHLTVNEFGWNADHLDPISVLLWTLIYCVIASIGFIIAALIHLIQIKKDTLGKTLKTIAQIIIVVLICGICVIANALNGNPASKALAKHASKNYISEQYSDTDYYIEEIGFNFKDTNYYARIRSDSSIDTQFTLYINMTGKVYFDTYEDVLTGSVTARRLTNAYRDLTDQIFENPAFPYMSNICFGSLEIYPLEAIQDPNATDIPSYAITQENLIPDEIYDIRKLGAQAGKLVIYIERDTVSFTQAAEIMLDIRRIFDEANVPFKAMDFVLQYPLPEEGQRPNGNIRVENFLYEDIHEEDLSNRIKAADASIKAYYAELDKKSK